MTALILGVQVLKQEKVYRNYPVACIYFQKSHF